LRGITRSEYGIEHKTQIKINVEIKRKMVKNGPKIGVAISTMIETGSPQEIKIGKESRNKKSCKESKSESFSMNFIQISVRYFITFVERKLYFIFVFW